MRFAADFHIHSKYSRATSKQCDLPALWAWAQRKGITVVGTGDFTHPAWFERLNECLEPAEPGLYRLKPEYEDEFGGIVPDACKGDVRFILTSEISNIYKKGDKTRKVHNLLVAPDLDTVVTINAALDKIGNIHSDGRPILGLDSRDLLEIALEAGEGTHLIPAHIWTPWFSVLGSKSGFESIEECYGDLSDHIFALETGLSSDPLMNWRLSSLDRYTLISNSDAHSPNKLGREANLFDCDLSYEAIFDAMKTRDGFLGTIEFFPEEGKYHLDGHRKCETRMEPGETLKANGLCPVCGKPVTVGVMHRVEVLADRTDGKKPDDAPDFTSLVPLPEVLGEVVGAGPATKKVGVLYEKMLEEIGPEFSMLMDTDEEKLSSVGGPVVLEAIKRIRQGNLNIAAGYDGEYGTVKIFSPGEREKLIGQTGMYSIPKAPKRKKKAASMELFAERIRENRLNAPDPIPAKPIELNPEQLEAIEHFEGPICITAGPGTGKTFTLTRRIAKLITEQDVPGHFILAVTFTNKAAEEMADRLEELLGEQWQTNRPTVATFHKLCLDILRKEAELIGLTRDFRILNDEEQISLIEEVCELPFNRAKKLREQISFYKQGILTPHDLDNPEVAGAWGLYEAETYRRHVVDLDDLTRHVLKIFAMYPDVLARYREKFRFLLVDEYQDVNGAQYVLLRMLAKSNANLCVIGDPDQAIYGFRGADHSYFLRFAEDYPEAKSIRLTQNYRSTGTILDGSYQIVEKNENRTEMKTWSAGDTGEQIRTLQTPTEKSEAEFIAHEIERLIGGVSHFSMDSDRSDGYETGVIHGFSEIAVLYRLNMQAGPLEEALDRLGIPYQCAGDLPFFQRPEVEKVMQILRAVAFDSPVSGMNQDLFKPVEELKAELLSQRVEDAVCQVLDEMVLDDDRADWVIKLKHHASVFKGTLREFCDNCMLRTLADERDPRAERVSLMSLHAAKGLEFPVVFIVGCEEGLIPYFRDGQSAENPEEERRLFFVGMTRAKKRLYLLSANSRIFFGKKVSLPRAPYLADIEKQLTDSSLPEEKKAGKKKDKSSQMTLF